MRNKMQALTWVMAPLGGLAAWLGVSYYVLQKYALPLVSLVPLVPE